jgi:hypothetical protein
MSTVALAVMLTGTGWESVPLAGGAIYTWQLSSRASHFIAFHASSIRSLQCNVGTTFTSPNRQDVAPGYCEVTQANLPHLGFVSELPGHQRANDQQG